MLKRLKVSAQNLSTRALMLILLIGTAAATQAEVTLATSVVRVSDALSGAATEPLEMVSDVLPGDVLRYTIVFENTSTQDVAARSVVITNPVPEGTEYLEGSATGADTVVAFSVDGEEFAAPRELVVGEGASGRAATATDYKSIRWTYQPLLRAGESSDVSFDLLIP